MTATTEQGCVMGIDFGERRIGVAVADRVTAHTQPLTTVSGKTERPDWQQIDRLIAAWQPTLFVVGRTGRTSSVVRKKITRFALQLKKRYNIPVNFVDEAYTSTAAKNYLTEQRRLGLARKKDGNGIDKIAAALILDTWLALDTATTNKWTVP